MKIGILGSGSVATTLAAGFIKHGHEVTLGTRDKSKLADFAKENPKAKIASFDESAKFGTVLVLTVKGSAAESALKLAGSENLAGKTIIDTTNPIADAPPENGVLKYFTDLNTSLMEILQAKYPQAHFVKAFNSVGAAAMVNPSFKGGKPTMFIAGNDAPAKTTVTGILDQFGWETEDLGSAAAARAIEPLCMLWCIPGFAKNDWFHAFKMLR
ncbi:MAG: NAD(P)-binding domain-containing protein [Aestuariivirga sp.]